MYRRHLECARFSYLQIRRVFASLSISSQIQSGYHLHTDCANNKYFHTGAVLAWAWFAKSGGLDWAITLFQLAALSNTIIVGIPVLTPLYSITTQGIPAIFIGQVLWLFVILFLYEVWGAMSERAAVTPVMTEVLGTRLENISEHASSVPKSLDHDLPGALSNLNFMYTCFSPGKGSV